MRWTLPNILTLGRLLAAPALPLAYIALPRPYADVAAFVLFVGAAVTDWFDGYLARRWNEVSRFGAMLDPIADKLMTVVAVAVLFALYGLVWPVVIPAVVILFREIFVSGLREFLGQEAGRLAVTNLAKWKTTAQLTAVSVLLAHGAAEGWLNIAISEGMARGADDPASVAQGLYWTALVLFWAGLILLWAAAILTGVTGWDYFSKARPLLKDAP